MLRFMGKNYPPEEISILQEKIGVALDAVQNNSLCKENHPCEECPVRHACTDLLNLYFYLGKKSMEKLY